MYKEYMTRTINEYNKIISTIDSCETVLHYQVVENMLSVFADNCDRRLENLKWRAWFGFSIQKIRDYINFNKYLSSLITYISQYYEYTIQEYKSMIESEVRGPQPHIVIKGFYNDDEYME